MKRAKKFPNPVAAVATLVALVVALVGGYFLLVAPKRHEATRLSQDVADVQRQIDEALAARTPSDVQPIRVADLFRLARAMPDQPDVPELLLELSQIARQTGISFKSITPGQVQSMGSYQKLPIDLAFVGHFYDLADFLYRLRNLVGVHDGTLTATGRLFTVDSIAFNAGAVAFPQVQATVKMEAYFYGGGVAPSTSATSAAPVPTGTTPESPAPAGASAAPAGASG